MPESAGGTDLEHVALVEAARGGDRDALARLFDRYAAMVHGIGLARLARADADDLVQDVFLVVMRKIGALRDSAAFGGWLATIARTRAVDLARSASRRGDEFEDLGRDDPDRGDTQRALAAIRALPEAYRETLILRLVEGMTGPEIAARTGLTPGSVRVNLHRGMKLLRQSLGIVEQRS